MNGTLGDARREKNRERAVVRSNENTNAAYTVSNARQEHHYTI